MSSKVVEYSGGFFNAKSIAKACKSFVDDCEKRRQKREDELYEAVKTVKRGWFWNRKEVILDREEAMSNYIKGDMVRSFEIMHINRSFAGEDAIRKLLKVANKAKHDIFVTTEDFNYISNLL